MFRGEQLEFRLHECPALFLFQRLVWIRRGRFLHPLLWLCHHQCLLLTSPASEVVQAMIHRNSVKPRRESGCAAEVGQRLEDFDKISCATSSASLRLFRIRAARVNTRLWYFCTSSANASNHRCDTVQRSPDRRRARPRGAAPQVSWRSPYSLRSLPDTQFHSGSRCRGNSFLCCIRRGSSKTPQHQRQYARRRGPRVPCH